MFSLAIPEMEIHMSGEPIGIFISPQGQLTPFKIKTKGSRYFVKNNGKVKGLFTVNNKYRYSWGKTSVYFFAQQETNQIDPVLVEKLNNWKKRNGLTEIKNKDVKHGRKLRTLLKQKDATDQINNLKKEETAKSDEIKNLVDEVDKGIKEDIKQLRDLHGKDVNPTNTEKGLILINHLKELGKFDDVEYAKYMDKVEKGTYTFDMLLDEMREKYDVQVSEPLDLNVEDFIQDLGAANASDLAGFMQDQIQGRKGLKDLTPVPVKSFMTGGIIIALLVGGAVLLAVGAPYITGESAIPTGGEGGLKMPWDLLGGFLFSLKSHLGMI